MSYYYSFSLGKKNEKGEIELYDNFRDFYYRSQSFIDGDTIREEMDRATLAKGDEYVDVFCLNASKVFGNCGLIDGFISIEDAKRYDYLKDEMYFGDMDLEIISKDTYCGMTEEARANYVRFVYCNKDTFDFVKTIAEELAESLPWEEHDKWYLVCIGG